MNWLGGEGSTAERPKIGKIGAINGKTTGMVGKNGAGGPAGFRVEHDARSGAHINVFSGKSKGPINATTGKPDHFEFDASAKTVDKIQRKYER